MDTNASLRRFYAFTTDTSATLPSSATPSDPQSLHRSSGSDSQSDDDGSGSQHSNPIDHPHPHFGASRPVYEVHNPPHFAHDRLQHLTATVYVDDSPYVPPGQSTTIRAPTFVQPGPDVLYDPTAQPFDPNNPTSTPSISYVRHSGENSPTDSNASRGSNPSGGISVSSQGSASSGVVSTGTSPHHHVFDVGDAFPPRQRVPGFNPEHYPAYDENFRRVGMEHARIGTDPRQSDQAYYRPRTHTYPPVGLPHASLGNAQPPTYDSPELQLLPMQPDEHPFDRDMRDDIVIPGQTRIHLPPPSASLPQDTQAFAGSTSSLLRSGDDAYVPTSDDEIRRFLRLGPEQELSLRALPDPPPGERPGHSIPVLSQLAILGSPNKRLTLQEIYKALGERFEWFKLNRHDKGWQNSIRHSLSLNKCFRRIPKPITEPGKGSYWVVDYSAGAGPGTKRVRKRNKRPTKAELRARAEAEAQGLAPQEEVESSQDEDEGPSQSQQDIPIDPLLQQQGHQVALGRVPSRPATRMARRGNSPYMQGPQFTPLGRHTRQGVEIPIAQSSRQLSSTFTQPSFGQPSLAISGTAIFGQPSLGGSRAQSSWQPGTSPPYPGSQMSLPPLHSRGMGGNSGPAPPDPRATLTRAHNLSAPTQMQHDARTAQAYYPLPPIQGSEQFRDSGRPGRSYDVHAAQAVAGPSGLVSQQQDFVQGSYHASRRASCSSESSDSQG